MKKLLFLASLMLSVTAIAGPVSQTKALNAANAFMTKHRTGVKLNVTPANSQRLNSSNQSSNQPYYVFNTVGDKGYVIVSGDDRTEEILGYVDHGSFDYDKLPANMKSWLKSYEQQIASLNECF